MGEKLLLAIQRNPKQAALRALFILVIIFLSLTILHHVRTGELVVSTGNTNGAIEVRSVSEKKPITDKPVPKKLHLRLKPGQYVVTINNRQTSSNKVVTVVARKTTLYSTELKSPITPSYVLPLGALSVSVSKQALYYVNSTNHILYRLDGSGVSSQVGGTVTPFSYIRWKDSTYGVGGSEDGKSLYEVKDGVISPLSVPFSDPEELSYDVSPSGHVVVSSGTSIYERSTSGVFKKIFASDGGQKITSIGITDSRIVVRFEASKSGESDGDEANTTIIDYSGQTVDSKDSLSAYTYKWSPDGSKLAVTNDTSTVIYDKHLKLLRTVGNINVNALSWADNNTLMYAISNRLQLYNYATGATSQIANTAITSAISGTFINDARDTVYLLVEPGDDSDTYSLQRVALKSAANVPDYETGLGIFFPSTSKNCDFSYSNFINPAIIITRESDHDICAAAAKEELISDKLPISPFIFPVDLSINELNAAD